MLSRSIGLAFVLALAASGSVKLPAIISDHMLMQRDVPVRIWGKADPGEAINVQFRGRFHPVKANSRGAWEVYLPSTPAGGPHTLAILGQNTISLQDVMVGDVWIASGQSNMVWTVARSDNAQTEIAKALHPSIRLFKVKLKVSPTPLDDVEGEWMVCSPDTVKDFSAVGYFFARALQDRYRIPMGIVQSAWGGSLADAWVDRKILDSDPSLKYTLDEWDKLQAAKPKKEQEYKAQLVAWERASRLAKKAGKEAPKKPAAPGPIPDQWTPGGLYNAMVAPLSPYAIRGVIWYQGESNAIRNDGYRYRHLFESMVRNWRAVWAQGDFPFLSVQLANFQAQPPLSWAELREAQRQTLELTNTAMAVTIDVGMSKDIHPTNKQDVGQRLALAARAVAYGDHLVYSGPNARMVTSEEGAARVWFDHIGRGLVARGRELQAFEVAGPDGWFFPGEARIDGDTVVVKSSQIAEPSAVRYAWAEDPPATLYNAEGLPASPFRVMVQSAGR